jgi:hypothetical protein
MGFSRRTLLRTAALGTAAADLQAMTSNAAPAAPSGHSAAGEQEPSMTTPTEWLHSPCHHPVPACIYYNRKKNERNITARSRALRAVSGEVR